MSVIEVIPWWLTVYWHSIITDLEAIAFISGLQIYSLATAITLHTVPACSAGPKRSQWVPCPWLAHKAMGDEGLVGSIARVAETKWKIMCPKFQLRRWSFSLFAFPLRSGVPQLPCEIYNGPISSCQWPSLNCWCDTTGIDMLECILHEQDSLWRAEMGKKLRIRSKGVLACCKHSLWTVRQWWLYQAAETTCCFPSPPLPAVSVHTTRPHLLISHHLSTASTHWILLVVVTAAVHKVRKVGGWTIFTLYLSLSNECHFIWACPMNVISFVSLPNEFHWMSWLLG